MTVVTENVRAIDSESNTQKRWGVAFNLLLLSRTFHLRVEARDSAHPCKMAAHRAKAWSGSTHASCASVARAASSGDRAVDLGVEALDSGQSRLPTPPTLRLPKSEGWRRNTTHARYNVPSVTHVRHDHTSRTSRVCTAFGRPPADQGGLHRRAVPEQTHALTRAHS